MRYNLSKIKKDKKVKELVKALFGVNEEVRDNILRQYLSRARELHLIAFLQWRWLYPANIVEKSVMEACISSAMKNYRDSAKDYKKKPKKATKDATTVSDKFFTTYEKKMISKGSDIPLVNAQMRSHVINSFTH